MSISKSDFIELAIQNNILKFGQFTLKSGRISPYFFNAGNFYQGSVLQKVGQAYATIILQNNIAFKHLFGPAYKGIPLATATAIALAEAGTDITVTFNRKEIKDHGEGGQLIGAPITGNTIIIDDVITAGVAFRESKQFIEAQGGTVSAIIIALDRCERGSSKVSTLHEIKKSGVEVFPVITLFDLLEYLKSNNEEYYYHEISKYIELYGCEAI